MARHRNRGRDRRGNDDERGGAGRKFHNRGGRNHSQGVGNLGGGDSNGSRYRGGDFRTDNNNNEYHHHNHSHGSWRGSHGNLRRGGLARGRRGRGGDGGPLRKRGNSQHQRHGGVQSPFGPFQGFHNGINPSDRSDTESDLSSYYGDDEHPGDDSNRGTTLPADPFAPYVQMLRRGGRARPCPGCRRAKKVNLRYRDAEAQRIQGQILAFLAWADEASIPLGCDAEEMDWQPEPLILFAPGNGGGTPPGTPPQSGGMFGEAAGFIGGGATGGFGESAGFGVGPWSPLVNSGLTIEPGNGFSASGFGPVLGVQIPRSTASGWLPHATEFRYVPGGDHDGSSEPGRWQGCDDGEDSTEIL